MAYNLERIVSPRRPIYRQLSQYYAFCENVRQMAPATILSKVYILNNFVMVTKLSDLRKVSNRHINYWIEEQKLRGNTGRSINVRLAHLRAMLHWQLEMNLKMPKLKLALIPQVKEYPPRKVYFTRQQIQNVLSRATELEWLLVSLAFDCGLRISEIANLRLEDLNAQYITIIGKGQKRRYAYLSNDVWQKLEAWMTRNQIKDYLWPSPIYEGRPLAICTIRKYIQDAFARVGIQDACPHDLRHSYATDLKFLGISTRQIQAGLGHTSENTTERYLSDLDGYDIAEMYRKKYACLAEDTNSMHCGKHHKNE